MELTKKQRNAIWNAAARRIVHGGRSHVDPDDICEDKRSVKKVKRELTEAGYFDGIDNWNVTDKIWNDQMMEELDLNAIWELSRADGGWNYRHALPIIRLESLTAGQQKWVACHLSQAEFHLVHELVTSYRYEMEDKYVVGPLKLGDEVCAARKAEGKHNGFDYRSELVFRHPDLTAYVERTLNREKYERTFAGNLPWALVKLGILRKGQSEMIHSGSKSDSIFGSSFGYLGCEPTKWGEELTKEIDRAKEKVVKLNKRIDVMETISEEVEEMGGWDVFLVRMGEEIAKEIAKEMSKEVKS